MAKNTPEYFLQTQSTDCQGTVDDYHAHFIQDFRFAASCKALLYDKIKLLSSICVQITDFTLSNGLQYECQSPHFH